MVLWMRAKSQEQKLRFILVYTTWSMNSCFTTDSQGFFKRSLLESCTASANKPILLPSGEVHFAAMLKGDKNKKYIFGVDPASEVDNFSIVVLELNSDHRRIVHSWTTTRQQHKSQLKSKIVDEEDFYSYCAKKIRSPNENISLC